MRITVVGAGVIGLTCAVSLSDAGHDVRIVSNTAWTASVSAVAGAIWFPFAAEASASVTAMQRLSLDRFTELARGTPAAGIDLRTGTVIERRVGADRGWASSATGVCEVDSDRLPAGAVAAVRAELPLITVPVYLEWLTQQARSRGIGFDVQPVMDIVDLEGAADAIVVAAGLGSRELLGDPEPMVPTRGQVVRVLAPNVHAWLLDDEHPAGLTYVLPRRDVVVLGGTAEPGETDETPNLDVERAILERCTTLVPALAEAKVVGRAVGLRPVRGRVRVERVSGYAVPVIAAYGHGGSGVTLSWGTAARVVDLVS